MYILPITFALVGVLVKGLAHLEDIHLLAVIVAVVVIVAVAVLVDVPAIVVILAGGRNNKQLASMRFSLAYRRELP